jgi:hypothetical protein
MKLPRSTITNGVSLTAYQNGRFRFIWALHTVGDARKLAVQWLREGRGRSAVVENGFATVWARGAQKTQKTG